MEGQGDLVSRFVTPITHIVTLDTHSSNLQTNSPDPPVTGAVATTATQSFKVARLGPSLVWGLGFRVSGLGFKVFFFKALLFPPGGKGSIQIERSSRSLKPLNPWGLEFRVLGLGFGI